MILVDTSIWIEYAGPRPGSAAARLDELVTTGKPFALTSVILQEILQGARSSREFRRLQQNLITQRFLHPLHPIESYAAAADIYLKCRRAGVTIRSTIDCLIAQIAIEHSATLLHNDADFDRMAKIIPGLVIH